MLEEDPKEKNFNVGQFLDVRTYLNRAALSKKADVQGSFKFFIKESTC